MAREAVLTVDRLKTVFRTRQGPAEAVSDVSFDIRRGETVAIVGESGSGKSVTALSVMRLLESTGRVAAGSIVFNGTDLASLTEDDMRKTRGREIAMVFQDPITCLDPVYQIGHQIREALNIHEDLSHAEAHARAVELLKMVGIPDPEQRLRNYPHQMSGGQRQRVMIAIALACRPKLLIADEPTTALDVTVQAQILELMSDLQKETGASMLLVTHDLGVVAEMADRVVVMYAGKVVEQGPVDDVLQNPQHPYTEALLKSNPGLVTDRAQRLTAIEGTVPSIFDMPVGCRFHPRCPYAWDTCVNEEPPLLELGEDRRSRCWLRDSDKVQARQMGTEVV